MRDPNLKTLALIILIAQSLISIACASDAKAILTCEDLSRTATISNQAAVKTAKAINKCKEATLSTEVQSRLSALEAKLPTSVRNAVFFKDVCIKNKRFNEYLYVPESGFKYDNETRRLFTWIGSPWQHDKGDFRLIPAEGDYFHVVSTNTHEYLFAAGNDYVANNRRKAFMWEPDWDDERQAFNDRQALWTLEPVDGTGRVYIKNRQYGEYFYAGETDLTYDPERRNVFIWSSTDNGCNRHDQCIWEIVRC